MIIVHYNPKIAAQYATRETAAFKIGFMDHYLKKSNPYPPGSDDAYRWDNGAACAVRCHNAAVMRNL
jgi:hypothetical protein